MTRDLAALLTALLLLIAPAARAQDYRLAPGDEVEFDILDDEEEIRTLTVGSDGRVQLPLLGGIGIGGLTVAEAIERIRTAYVERDLLRDPAVSLSIATFRPVFVLGDVDQPGMIEFRPQMTVEQAVGLAGGPSRITDNSDEQLLSEANLRGELRVIGSELARQAAVVARLRAVLSDGDALDFEAVPEAVRDLVDRARFDDYAEIEAQLLAQDRDDLADEIASIESQIEALTEEIALLGARIETQEAQIASFVSERDRVAQLVERGTLARVALIEAENDLFNAEVPLLESQRRQTEAERQRAVLERRLSEIESDARRNALQALQEARLDLDRLLARQASTEERIFLVTSWQSTRSQDAFSIETSFRIRRDAGEGLVVTEAGLTDRLLPGDVLLVTIELPG
jgi:exopolysaccharide production protein ExoF